jgi:hypothetical protein
MESTGVRLVLSIYKPSSNGGSVSTLLCYIPGDLCDERTDAMLENISRLRYINVEPLSICLDTEYEPEVINKDILLFNILISPMMDSLDMNDSRDTAYISANFLDIPQEDAFYYTGLWCDHVEVFRALCSGKTWTTTSKDEVNFDMNMTDIFNRHQEAPVYAFNINFSLFQNPVDRNKIREGSSYEGIRLPVIYSKDPSKRNLKNLSSLRFENRFWKDRLYEQKKKEIDSLFTVDVSMCEDELW